ncbi:hypothetical protein HanPSC8_Chr17g0775331 [Helianthus annuus]|nr:hypothetical protein HanPSC8_Chr17g0775331 [Helianthus annuus]
MLHILIITLRSTSNIPPLITIILIQNPSQILRKKNRIIITKHVPPDLIYIVRSCNRFRY